MDSKTKEDTKPCTPSDALNVNERTMSDASIEANIKDDDADFIVSEIPPFTTFDEDDVDEEHECRTVIKICV